MLVLAIAASAVATAEPAPASPPPELPHLHVDREAGFVEIDAEVIGGDADWLELLVCTAGGREHEALLRTPALPSHAHLGLLLLGLEPGTPTHAAADGTLVAASGPTVRVTVRSPDDAFAPADAGSWILDHARDASLADAGWIFTGSRVLTDAQGPAFLADVNGTVASLVSFGDDLVLLDLARTDGLDSGNDRQRFVASDAVPPAGTAVRIRFEPAAPARPVDTGAATLDTATTPPPASPSAPASAGSAPQDAAP